MNQPLPKQQRSEDIYLLWGIDKLNGLRDSPMHRCSGVSPQLFKMPNNVKGTRPDPFCIFHTTAICFLLNKANSDMSRNPMFGPIGTKLVTNGKAR